MGGVRPNPKRVKCFGVWVQAPPSGELLRNVDLDTNNAIAYAFLWPNFIKMAHIPAMRSRTQTAIRGFASRLWVDSKA